MLARLFYPAVSVVVALLTYLTLTFTVRADDADITYQWLSETEDILAEGIIWNDGFGDGKDRYKSGGLTQSWVFPERIFSETGWFKNRASAIEVQARALVMTPGNTQRVRATDRPWSQYAGVGVYLRSATRPDRLTSTSSYMIEDRAGIEFGYQGDPLPLFDLQDSLHDATGMGTVVRTRANTLDPDVVANIEARRTWRIHSNIGAHDMQLAPFVHASTGLRENAIRTGGDIIVGSSLEARTFNSDPAIGALIPGGSKPRNGVHWMAWLGADVGLIGSDIFLDGGVSGSGPSVERDLFTLRARGGVMLEYDNFSVSYSVNWLSPEYKTQPEGQLIGAVQLKVNF